MYFPPPTFACLTGPRLMQQVRAGFLGTVQRFRVEKTGVNVTWMCQKSLKNTTRKEVLLVFSRG